MDQHKQALLEIKKIAAENDLSWDDVRKVLQIKPEYKAESGPFEVSEMLAYIGGMLIFAGIGVYTTMFWGTLSSVFRIVLTFGSGFSCFCIALGLSRNSKYQKVTQALFLISAFLQPLGLFVFLHEVYGVSSNIHIATLFVFGIMFIQQLATFWEKRLNLILFMVLFFGLGFVATLFDYLVFYRNLVMMGLGTSLFLINYSFKNTPYRPVIGFWYFIANVLFLSGAFNWLYNTPYEIVFVWFCGLSIYMSIITKSKTILFTSTIALLGYIGRYTMLHFVNSVGWPISLIIVGAALIFLSGFALKIKQKYM